MSELELQIKITSAAQQAVNSIKQIDQGFKNIAKDAGIARLAVAGFETAGKNLKEFGNQLDQISKSLKKFGRDFTVNVTTPIAALAALSLKKVFDLAIIDQGTGVTNRFGAEVQALKKNFDLLLISLGTQLAPIATRVVSFFNNMITVFRSLSPETRSIVLNFALFAAAIGPVTLALSSFIGIVGKVIGVLGAIATGFGTVLSALLSVPAFFTAIALTVAGLVNVFLDLRKAGVGTADALRDAFYLFVTGFNNYIVGTLLIGISKLLKALGGLAGFFSSGMKKGLDAAAAEVSAWDATLKARFDGVKAGIDTKLETIGTSAGESFTFGLSTSIGELTSQFSNMFNGLTQASGQKLVVFGEQIKQITQQIKEQISGDLAGAFLDFAEGTKTAEQAFADFARSTIRQLTQMILQAQLFRLLFPQGGALSGAAAGVAGASTIPPAFADGGPVSGPGSGRSDSILARLSNGEYVMDAKTVRTFGTGFFKNLQGFSKSGVSSKRAHTNIPGFADGGLVSSSSGAPQVVIQNTGSPKEVDSTSFDPASQVTTVILQDIQKNGAISKSLQSTFKMKRGGFR